MAAKRSASNVDNVLSQDPPPKKAKAFRFKDEHIDNLISCLLNYKVKCEFDNIDFDADKPTQYTKIRDDMAGIYRDEEDLFGPLENEKPDKTATKEEKALFNDRKKLVTRGYKRIQEKIKDLRQGFSKAIVNGTRSGSGKFVYEHYDRLKQIWGGSPNTEPLTCGIDTSSVNMTQIDGDNAGESEDENLENETVDNDQLSGMF